MKFKYFFCLTSRESPDIRKSQSLVSFQGHVILEKSVNLIDFRFLNVCVKKT